MNMLLRCEPPVFALAFVFTLLPDELPPIVLPPIVLLQIVLPPRSVLAETASVLGSLARFFSHDAMASRVSC